MINSTPALNIFNSIRTEFGTDALHLINNHITLSKKLGNWLNHRIFNLRCLQHDIIPRTICVKAPDPSIRSKNAARTASRIFIRQRIHSCTLHINELRVRISRLDEIITHILPSQKQFTIKTLLDERQRTHFTKAKSRQLNKFIRLKESSVNKVKNAKDVTNPDTMQAVHNLSDRILTEDERKLLQKGLNFNVVRNKLKLAEVIPVLEPALKKIPVNEANVIRLETVNLIRHQPTPAKNLTRPEMKALSNLKKDNSIHITRADKGNITVILNKKDYVEKAFDHLTNGPYSRIDESKRRTVLNKAKASLCKYLRGIKEKIDNKIWFSLAPKSNNPARFYGLPKIHKQDVPLRPIVDYTLSPAYKLSKYLSQILKPLQKTVVSHMSDSFDCLNKHQHISLNSDDVFLSFNVASLYTSIPIASSLEYICTLLSNDSTLANRTSLSPNEILRGIELCLSSTYFVFQNLLFQQTEGVAMGSPLAPIVANLFMSHIESECLKKLNTQPIIWLRYVDDIFVILKRNTIDELHTILNSQCSTIRFTLERAEDEKILPFLDCLLKRNGKNFDVSIYRKPTHSDLYLNCESSHPECIKRSLIRTLFGRIEKICTTSKNKKYESNRLTEVLQKNGYNKNTIQRFRKPPLTSSNSTEPTATVTVPYIPGSSEALRRLLRKFNLRTAFRIDNTLGRMLNKNKDKLDKQNCTNLVYQIPCKDCPAVYIGQTSRQLQVRLQEHKRCQKRKVNNQQALMKLHQDSAIALHALAEGHDIDFDSTKIIQHGFHTHAERLAAEALHINMNDNCINRIDGTTLSTIWCTSLQHSSLT